LKNGNLEDTEGVGNITFRWRWRK